jgi:hypothetical protein
MTVASAPSGAAGRLITDDDTVCTEDSSLPTDHTEIVHAFFPLPVISSSISALIGRDR